MFVTWSFLLLLRVSPPCPDPEGLGFATRRWLLWWLTYSQPAKSYWVHRITRTRQWETWETEFRKSITHLYLASHEATRHWRYYCEKKTYSSMTRVCCSHAKSRCYTFQNNRPNENIGWFDYSQREQNNYCVTDRKISLLWNKRWINASFSRPASAEMKTNAIYRFANRNWTKGWRSSNYSST